MNQVILSGLVVGAAYVLAALGFAIQFEIADIVNLAHGAFVVGGMYVTLRLANADVPLYLAVLAPVIIWAFLAGLIYLMVMGPARDQSGHRVQVVYSILLLSGITVTYQIIFGADTLTIHNNYPNIHILGATATAPQVASFLISVVLSVGLYIVAKRTRIGKMAYAAGRYPTGARAIGISVERVYLWVFVIGGALAGLGGGLIVTSQPVDPTQCLEFTLIASLVAIVARTHLIGCLVLGLCYGVVQELVGYYISSQFSYPLSLCIFLALLATYGYNNMGWIRIIRTGRPRRNSGVS
jgi:branched-chain amino acid transport system permease protein